MSNNSQARVRKSRRHGTAIIWTVMMVIVMFGFCSLAVDLGRVITTKTELRRCTDAAARAGVAVLSSTVTNSTVQNTVKNLAALDKANNASITINNADIQWGIWNSATKTFTAQTNANTSGVNAIKVTARCTSANGNPVSLMFGTFLGASTCDVTATSVAALGTTTTTWTGTILATSNLWLAGAPNGTQGSVPDPNYPSAGHPWRYDVAGPTGSTISTQDAYGDPVGEAYASPTQAPITLIPGASLSLSSVSGTAGNHFGTASTNADGVNGGSINSYKNDAASPGMDLGGGNGPGYTGNGNGGVSGSEHGIANINTPINSLNALFLDANDPSTEAGSNGTNVPPGLDFSTQTARDYTTVSPLVRQPFYVGDGQTSSGTQQNFIVPSGATRLFFGSMDGHEWSNNVGGFTVTLTQTVTAISIVQ